VIMDDRTHMIEALHERVLALLGEGQSEPDDGRLPLVHEIPR